MLVAMLCTFDRNGFSHHATNMIGGATVWTNLNHTHLITVMCNMLELYELIQDVREFKIFFSEFDNFQSSAKKPVGGVSSWLEQTMIVQHQGI